ncbi:hypothetical protein DL89DRAFT_269250 [Linderina pennispora]|uniref:DinB-like domain-containing protein n=1 Tax=Linderina pennispora TaxID=61395 RepID=A0A1Y1W1V7_9FUNG|nr:uncharacterized protein DL89DRAFT_269250 [Linderina pennispora]ORX67432.1 hypothetical protein DL89DRAFT_269250 [Linderina pennispora]
MDSNTTDQLFDSATTTLAQLTQTIHGLDASTYTRDSSALPGSTIGKHVRHILDHFNLLGCNADTMSVNYAQRIRNVSTESDVQAGLEAIRQAVACAEGLRKQGVEAGEAIEVVDVMSSGSEVALMSTVGRELWFCVHHMVHHNAVIAQLFFEFGLTPSLKTAYAPSTLKASK